MAESTQEQAEAKQDQEDTKQDQDDTKQDQAESPEEHLLNHLRDVHALELQALRQLARAVDCTDDESRGAYEEHLEQTKSHEQKIKELVEAHGHTATVVEDKTLRGGAIGLRQLSDITLDSPAKVAMNLFALEHLEIAAYELLAEIAQAVDDKDSGQAAEQIVEEKRQAAEAVAETFDRAAQLFLEEKGSGEDSNGKSEDQLLLAYLQDVHALEQQALQLLRIGVEDLCHDDELEQALRQHLEQTEEHEQLINARIEAHDAKPSAIRDLHMSTAKSGLHDLLKDPPDAPVKLAMNLFCVQHLHVAAYELLGRIAKQAGDQETAEAAEKMLEEEREAAQAVRETFSRSVELMLDSDRSYAGVRAGESPRDEDS